MPPANPNLPPAGPQPRAPGNSIDSTPYDFIMNPGNKTAKKSGLPLPPLGGAPGRQSKLLLIAGGGLVLVIVLFVVFLLLGNQSTDPGLVTIAQEQTELVRVAGLQYDNLSDPDTQNFVMSTELTIQSNQQDYLQYLSANGAGINTKKLSQLQNSRTDAALASAQADGTLDSTLVSTLTDQLTNYQHTLQTTYNQLHKAGPRAELKTLYDQAGLLLQQAKVAAN